MSSSQMVQELHSVTSTRPLFRARVGQPGLEGRIHAGLSAMLANDGARRIIQEDTHPSTGAAVEDTI